MTDLNEKLRRGLFIGLIISLTIYHLANQIKLSFMTPTNNIFDLVSLIELSITIVVFYLVVFNKFIARIFLLGSYLGGEYDCESSVIRNQSKKQQNESRPNNESEKSIEKISIVQNLFEVSLTGKSFRPGTQELISIWTGKLFKVEGDNYYFGLEVALQQSEFGILRLTIDKDKVYGFYYSGNPNNTDSYILSGKKKKQTISEILLEIFS